MRLRGAGPRACQSSTPPGLGSLMIEAIQKRDYPVVQGCVLVISLTYVLVNTLTDLVYAWIDPRIRLGMERR